MWRDREWIVTAGTHVRVGGARRDAAAGAASNPTGRSAGAAMTSVLWSAA